MHIISRTIGAVALLALIALMFWVDDIGTVSRTAATENAAG